MELSFLPLACLNLKIVNSNNSFNGSGPLALPPKVFNLAPAGRIFLRSYFGTSPEYNNAISCLRAFAQPSLLSDTTIVVSLSKIFSGISGSLSIYLCSTLNPTPVPHNRIYIASSKLFGSSIGR